MCLTSSHAIAGSAAVPPCRRASVVVTIPTYRRPVWLARLLRALEKLETTASVSVLVADNDAVRHEGADICAALAAVGYRWPLRAVVVADRGLSQVRNALFAEVLKSDDRFIAMLDDDEWPAADWLENYLRVQRETGADVVQGPVRCQFESEPPAIVELANTTFPPRRDSGAIDVVEAAGNILLQRACLSRLGAPWFDPQLGLAGGEDKDFFLRLRAQGASFAWAAGAIAYTSIPVSRMSRRWALLRGFRTGGTDMRMKLKYEPGLRMLALESAKIAGALVLAPFWFLACAGRASQRARASYVFARALGKIGAAFGAEYLEYRTTHGL